MNKSSLLVAALLGAATLCGAQTTPAPQPTPAAGQSGLSSSMANGSGMQLSTGTVVEYKPGQRIGVKVSEHETVTLDLNPNVRVDGLVAEGRLAAVMWMGESGGGRRVTSITAAPGPGDAGTADLASSYQKMDPTPGAKGAATPTPKPATPRTTPARPTPTPKP